MNSKRVRSLLLSAALLFVLFLSWFIGRSIFVQGPYIKDRSADLRLHRQLMEAMRAPAGELVNRYALNEVTYISRVTSLQFNSAGSRTVRRSLLRIRTVSWRWTLQRWKN